MPDDDRPTPDDTDSVLGTTPEDGAEVPHDEQDQEPEAQDREVGADVADDEPVPLALPLWKLVAGGVLVVLVVLAAVIGAIVLLGGGDDDDGGRREQAADPSVVDSFDRADAPNELGATESGQPWTAESGVWGVEDEQAVLVEPNPQGQRSIAVVDIGSPNGTVSATAGTMAQGWGLVFRYQGPFNYWYLTASPDFATYNLARVVDGEVQPLGGVGLAEVADGSVVQVRLDGATIEISVNGNPVKAITDTTLIGATKAGLLASGELAASASWESFEATPGPGATAGGVTPQTVPAPATTAADPAPPTTVEP